TTIDSWELVPAQTEKQDAYRVFKRNGRWLASVRGKEAAEPDTGFLRRSLLHINHLQANKELNLPEEKWDSLGVTEKSTKLLTFKNGKVVNEIFLGKLFFDEQKKATYYVRLKGENKVYTVPQYLEGSLKMPAEKMRKKALVGVPSSQISEIMFLNPNGIDFILKRAGQNAWSINGILTNDSIGENYVFLISQLEIASFGTAPTMGADLSLQITTYKGNQVSLRAYKKNSETWILSSSENTGNYVEVPNDFIQRLFPGREFFMQPLK
ncbi:MAG: DUF4340 domain-containing protein, partial [Sphingobacteriales bacterium]